MQESERDKNRPSSLIELLVDICFEFLPNLVMGIFRPIAHFLGEVFHL